MINFTYIKMQATTQAVIDVSNVDSSLVSFEKNDQGDHYFFCKISP